MHAKLPAMALVCAILGTMAPDEIVADNTRKKSAETPKSGPGKKPKKQRTEKRNAARIRIRKLEDELAAKYEELDKARESLHTAQKELAARDEAIEDLRAKSAGHENALKRAGDDVKKANSQLRRANEELKKLKVDFAKANDEIKKFKASDFNKLAHTLDEERKRNAELRNQLKETQRKSAESLARLRAQSTAPPKKPEPKKTAATRKTPAIAPVHYDRNCAVNFEERDRVLRQLRAVLKQSPNATIQITGYADDTPYKQANVEVGSNRASFLARYLVLMGLPQKQITCRGVGSSKQGSGNGNRKAVIQIRN